MLGDKLLEFPPDCIISALIHVEPFFQILQSDQAVRPGYLDGQEVTGNMRAILIDWLARVQINFRLLQETMYMTVSIIDRFLQVGTLSISLPGPSFRLCLCVFFGFVFFKPFLSKLT